MSDQNSEIETYETSNPKMQTLSDGTTTYDVEDKNALHLSGGTMSGAIDMDSNGINNLVAPTSDLDAATKKYVDDAISAAVENLVTTSQLTSAISGITLESLGGGSVIKKIWSDLSSAANSDEVTVTIPDINTYESFIIVTGNSSDILPNSEGFSKQLINYLNTNVNDIGSTATYNMYFGYRNVTVNKSAGTLTFSKGGYRSTTSESNVSSYIGHMPRIIYGIVANDDVGAGE